MNKYSVIPQFKPEILLKHTISETTQFFIFDPKRSKAPDSLSGSSGAGLEVSSEVLLNRWPCAKAAELAGCGLDGKAPTTTLAQVARIKRQMLSLEDTSLAVLEKHVLIQQVNLKTKYHLDG
ncbi:hypothetical protein CEXT_706091 [Caerostris extrusa]|uniref:Uncharacterized protein n=1 Tax=Caerostris extrusa TaxID=172846 RepID=A0AAV4XC37_CAEEX|nr:hypothetical protein CEXT_706091 [Caerostris extrusa]